MIRESIRVAVLSVAAVLAGCAGENPFREAQTDPKERAVHLAVDAQQGKSAVATLRPSRAAATQPAANNVTGTVTFTDSGNGQVKVVAEVTGLAPSAKHGFHVHEKGDLSAADLATAGPHFNPAGHQHGGPGPDTHAGDLGNLQSDATGRAKLELTTTGLSVGTGQPNDVVGKSVIVHAKADDLRSQPAGDSGARIAGGVVEAK